MSIFTFFVQLIQTGVYAEDLLEKAFFPARQQETVINLGNTKRTVGNEILREGVTINASIDGIRAALGGDFDGFVQTRQPRIVRFTKFLLRATVVLAVVMVIINGIKYILALGDAGGTTEAKDNLKYIIIGLLIALGSLAIVNLINSITLGTLGAGR